MDQKLYLLIHCKLWAGWKSALLFTGKNGGLWATDEKILFAVGEWDEFSSCICAR